MRPWIFRSFGPQKGATRARTASLRFLARSILIVGALVLTAQTADAACGAAGQAPGWVSTDWYACGWPVKLFACWQRNYVCCPGSATDSQGICRAAPTCDASCQVKTIVSLLGTVNEVWLSAYGGVEPPNGGPLYQYRVKRSDLGNVSSVKIDVAGEGSHLCTVSGTNVPFGYTDTINLNSWNKVTCNGPDYGKPIPNFVAGNIDHMPFESDFADTMYMQNGPTDRGNVAGPIADEFARVLHDNGTIGLTGYNDNDLTTWAQNLATLVHGRITSSTVDPNGYLNIVIQAGTYNRDEL
jgi:hypothetical protein